MIPPMDLLVPCIVVNGLSITRHSTCLMVPKLRDVPLIIGWGARQRCLFCLLRPPTPPFLGEPPVSFFSLRVPPNYFLGEPPVSIFSLETSRINFLVIFTMPPDD